MGWKHRTVPLPEGHLACPSMGWLGSVESFPRRDPRGKPLLSTIHPLSWFMSRLSSTESSFFSFHTHTRPFSCRDAPQSNTHVTRSSRENACLKQAERYPGWRRVRPLVTKHKVIGTGKGENRSSGTSVFAPPPLLENSISAQVGTSSSDAFISPIGNALYASFSADSSKISG